MGAIGGLLGLNGGFQGSGAQTPQQANIVQPTNAGQIGQAYSGAQGSLQQQQALLQALQGQNGIGNQNQVYGQLQGVANGTGPNPAQNMLNQATGQNVANQAALMAGQRGAGSNVGMIARQAGQQGAATQQQAAGQAATLQANQSLNALGAAGNMANNQVANQIGAVGANTNANLAEQANLLGAQGQANAAAVGSQQSVNQGNTALATGIMGQQTGIIGGLSKGASAGSIPLQQAHGGLIEGGPVSSWGKKMAQGGPVNVVLSPGELALDPEQAREVAVDKSKAPQIMGQAKVVPGQAKVKGDSLKNDIVPDKLRPGSVVVPRSKAGIPEDAAKFIEAALAKKGKKK